MLERIKAQWNVVPAASPAPSMTHNVLHSPIVVIPHQRSYRHCVCLGCLCTEVSSDCAKSTAAELAKLEETESKAVKDRTGQRFNRCSHFELFEVPVVEAAAAFIAA